MHYVVNKDMINDLYHKTIINVTGQTKLYPRFAGRRASSSFALHEGLIGGARGGAMTGALIGGGVIRWGSSRGLICTTIWDVYANTRLKRYLCSPETRKNYFVSTW